MSPDSRSLSPQPARFLEPTRMNSGLGPLRLGAVPVAWVGAVALAFTLFLAVLAYPPIAHPFSPVQSNDPLTAAFATFPWVAVAVGANWLSVPRTPPVDPLVVLRAN